jgi:hypothetical protein
VGLGRGHDDQPVARGEQGRPAGHQDLAAPHDGHGRGAIGPADACGDRQAVEKRAGTDLQRGHHGAVAGDGDRLAEAEQADQARQRHLGGTMPPISIISRARRTNTPGEVC